MRGGETIPNFGLKTGVKVGEWDAQYECVLLCARTLHYMGKSENSTDAFTSSLNCPFNPSFQVSK